MKKKIPLLKKRKAPQRRAGDIDLEILFQILKSNSLISKLPLRRK